METVEMRIKSKLKDVLNMSVEEKDLEQDLSSKGIDSVAFVKFLVAIEGEFGIEFDEEELDFRKYQTLGELFSFVENKVGNL